MTRKIPVTREGLERLTAELDELINVRRPAITEALAEARSHGDLRENSAYDAARHDQVMNEKRIADLEALVRNAEVVDDAGRPDDDVVRLGSTVVVDFDGEEERYTLVGAIEAKPAVGRISNESPIGKSLLGKRPGEFAEVGTPGGNRKVDIVSVAGCLREQPAGTWLLTAATDPVKSSANAPDKKEWPTSQAAGKNQFQLIGVSEFNLPSLKDQYVVIKGLHIVASPTSRLNVTSVTPVFPSCTNAGK